jgi:hypothetical protein
MERKELEAAATSYPHLRGLMSVPLGVMMVVAALSNWNWGPLRHDWVFVACLVPAALAVLAIKRSYDDHYGRMTSTTRNQWKAGLATAAAAALVLGGSALARSEASWSLDLPVNGIAAALAAGLLIYYAVTVGLKPHHLVIWGAVLVAGVLPVWGGLSLGDTGNVGLVLGGAAAIASGLLDHRLLTRTFGDPHAFALKAGDVGA